jgi:hypothetical protein
MDKIKMDLKEIEWESTVWIHVAKDKAHWQAFVNTAP